MSDLATRRLRAQRLTGQPFNSAVDAVRWMGAVQAQDYAGAKWGLGQRVRGAGDAELDRLFDAGAILRTHVMRPTWHFVLPDDVRWLLALTAPRIRAGLSARHRDLGIDKKVMARANKAFAAALSGGGHLSRSELGEVLRASRIAPDGQRLPHLLMSAELDALIVSGPRRGKQFTYALLDERVASAPAPERGDAIAELTRRYFWSHGPAQLADFAWWSGLTVADARAGIAQVGAGLEHETIDGKDYWFDAGAEPAPAGDGSAHLLPNFDEYTVAYRDRKAALHPDRPFEPAFFSFGSILSNVVIVGGRVRGAWRRTIVRRGVHVEIRSLDQFNKRERAAVDEAGRRLSRFLERPVEIAYLYPGH